MELDIRLFGAPRILVDGREVILPYKKADAVLYYVLLKGSATRSRIAELLWPDAPVETGLKNLRHAIYSIRKHLGENPFFEQQRSTLTLSPHVIIRCDALAFLNGGSVDLYAGELLEGVSIPSADTFEAWMQEERERFQGLYLDRLLEAAQNAMAMGELKRAEQYCLRHMQIDRTEENNVMLLMRIYRKQHQFRKAIELYQTLCKTLEDEFGISPLSDTTELYYEIMGEWNRSVDEVAKGSECLLLGKEIAQRKLQELCNDTRQNRRHRCILLEGEAGVGKTCLLEWALKSCDLSDRAVCRGTCYQTETEHFLTPWNMVMASLISETEYRGMSLPTQHVNRASALFPALTQSSDALEKTDEGYPIHVNYVASRQSALMLLSAVSRRLPLLLVFEDIHWMDKSSVEMLSMLLRQMQHADISVICTCRDILPDHVDAFLEAAERDKILERCHLRNFTLEETTQYLRFYAPQELSAEQTSRVYRATGGNALLLSQTISSLAEIDDLPVLSNGLEDIIAYRLTSLSTDERRVLELVSVFIGSAPLEALSFILQKSMMEQICLCLQLTQKKLLVETEENGALSYGFSHEQIKAIVSERLSITARRMLCLRVAEYLQKESRPDEERNLEQMIYYYEEGGDRFHALRCKILALEHDASIYYELMPTLGAHTAPARQDEDRLMEYYGSLETQLASLRRSCMDGDRGELDLMELMLLHAESYYYVHEGRYDKGLPVLERLLKLAEASNNRKMMLNAHRQYIYYGIQTCDREAMGRHIECATALLGSEDGPERGVFLRLRGFLLLLQEAYGPAREVLRQAIEIFLSLEDQAEGKYAINIAGCYNYIAEAYRLEGDFTNAFANYDQAIRYNRKRDFYPGAAVFYTNYGVAFWQTGRFEEARTSFLHAESLYTASHEYSAYPIALSYLAYYDVEAGNDRQAADRLKRALALSERIGSGWWMGVTIYMLWKIRKLLEAQGRSCQALEALWPRSRQEHCAWALSYLAGLPPRLERDELEQDLHK